MFRSDDIMSIESTPERVLAVCRTVACGSMTKKQLAQYLCLSGSEFSETPVEIRDSVRVAEEKDLGLIRQQDGKLILTVSPEVLATPVNFRRYVSGKVFRLQESTFVRFSTWFIAKNDQAFRYGNWRATADAYEEEKPPEDASLGKNALQGWRFWAAFLGLGYLSGSVLIPNMKIRIQDVLVTRFPQKYEYGQQIRAREFVSWLALQLPEARLSPDAKLPLAVSAGLRTLRDLDLIRLENWQDSQRVYLFPLDISQPDAFSHITVNEEVCR